MSEESGSVATAAAEGRAERPGATIESVLQEGRTFAPPPQLAAAARIGSLEAYRDLVAQADADPDRFWGELARRELHWFEPFHTVLDWSSPPFARWFEGGATNLSFNCLDRHINGPRAEIGRAHV